MASRLEAIATIYQSQPQATSIESLKYYIDELFSDENSPVTLSTIHKYKGGEGEVILSGLLVAMMVIGVRSFGLLQPLEFQAFDWLMRMRPYEGVDSRLLIVEATEKDINRLGYSISDGKLAETIERIKQHKPSIISEQKYQELILKNLRQKAQALGLELIPISHSTECVS